MSGSTLRTGSVRCVLALAAAGAWVSLLGSYSASVQAQEAALSKGEQDAKARMMEIDAATKRMNEALKKADLTDEARDAEVDKEMALIAEKTNGLVSRRDELDRQLQQMNSEMTTKTSAVEEARKKVSASRIRRENALERLGQAWVELRKAQSSLDPKAAERKKQHQEARAEFIKQTDLLQQDRDALSTATDALIAARAAKNANRVERDTIQEFLDNIDAGIGKIPRK